MRIKIKMIVFNRRALAPSSLAGLSRFRRGRHAEGDEVAVMVVGLSCPLMIYEK